MKTPRVKRYLESFAKQVVRDSRKILSSAKGNTALAKSIRAVVETTSTGFRTKFYMADYGTFLDEGVSGTNKKQRFENYKGVKKISSYSYTTKGPPIDIISKWIKKKGIQPKGLGRGRSKKTGQYISGFAYLISRKIKRDGIKSISFFQKPLGVGLKELENNFLKELKLDIQSYLTTFTKTR
tara:strand:+ start:454 stop:999 length:546 start_codon:yes stop_codon:yes gene_type:complete